MIRQRAQEYLAMRRALGFKLTTWGAKLMSFVGYLESTGARVITTDAAVAWATSTPRASTDTVHWSRRLDVVRIFARHLKTLDAATEVPPEDILAHHYRRITPYLYSPDEITALLQAAGRLTPALRGRTWQTVLGLLAVTCGSAKPAASTAATSTCNAMSSRCATPNSASHATSRCTRPPPPRCATTTASATSSAPHPWWAAFVSTRGTRLDSSNMAPTFAALLAAAGIDPVPGRRRQRIHDLRHSFTVAT